MTAFNLGVQARYAVNPLAGAYMFGNGRFGIEDGRMDRNVHVNDYIASNYASWKGLSGSFMAGGGYRWALSENLSAGPTASLNYTTLSRRGMTETGSSGSHLKLDSNTFNSQLAAFQHWGEQQLEFTALFWCSSHNRSATSLESCRAQFHYLHHKIYITRSRSKTPHNPIPHAIVVGIDQTIICCFASLMPIILLTIQNKLSLKQPKNNDPIIAA
ncbi:hypothetical protein Xvie_01686 [Xenorhabdus vietnamensis]|uniref:Autotransporter domain-containing protein n=1 Tax=Xenorhabdus vietnamensis TaxID=351656 RepID=A0A1Y2SF42_9GAMM|nr:hypothetical protein Xvie_03132 [Xenorhabdus vietnamensis]OTA16603.1 hypothetical protein Xvie_01686 [Xenorhabdus vietnamensis]